MCRCAVRYTAHGGCTAIATPERDARREPGEARLEKRLHGPVHHCPALAPRRAKRRRDRVPGRGVIVASSTNSASDRAHAVHLVRLVDHCRAGRAHLRRSLHPAREAAAVDHRQGHGRRVSVRRDRLTRSDRKDDEACVGAVVNDRGGRTAYCSPRSRSRQPRRAGRASSLGVSHRITVTR